LEFKMNIIMKRIKSGIFAMIIVAGVFLSACTDDLLNQIPTTELGASEFWKTEKDATDALMGAYAHVRGLFDRDYYFDGQGEYVRNRAGDGILSNSINNVTRGGAAYYGGNYFPDPAWGYGRSFDRYYRFSYGGVHRVNYVIENTERMLANAAPGSVEILETVIGEARLLRGMIYFRLISMWGDVPYIDRIIYDNSEVANISRMPIGQIKDRIYEDFTYAFEKLPRKASQNGRASKPAALAFRGKLQLYWASWHNFGWPELEDFVADPNEAIAAYTAAAADFKSVIEDYGLNLFRNGEPGQWGEMGKADILPNYFYLFIPNHSNPDYDGEFVFAFNHGGPGTGQGDALMRDFAGRNFEGSQCWITPQFQLANRYQSTITGDFLPPFLGVPPGSPHARTHPQSALNPAAYENRDYRMKATMLWEREVQMGIRSLQETDWVPLIYKSWGVPIEIDGKTYTTYETDGTRSGYVFRKFVRNYGGAGRDEGDFSWPVMRLADVFLMYAEATNEINGPQQDAIDLLNRIRRRGNLPALAAEKTASKEAFFDAIEQERIVELVAEGHRAFDIRRWRALERIWGPPGSPEVFMFDTHGAPGEGWFSNLPEISFQQGYIFRIPPEERDRNPNLTQNRPWR
jgi:starch-binding outer membrane protein, SusD/RagB family